MTAKERREKKELFIEILTKNLGVVTAAARAVGVSRVCLYDWRNQDPDFKAKWDAVTEVALDFVENALMKRVQDGDTKAIIYYLNCKGQGRGYGNKVEFNGDLTVNRPKAVFIDTDEDQ